MTKEAVCKGCCGLPVSKCDCDSSCKVCGGKDNMGKSFRSYLHKSSTWEAHDVPKTKCRYCGKAVKPTAVTCPSCHKMIKRENKVIVRAATQRERDNSDSDYA